MTVKIVCPLCGTINENELSVLNANGCINCNASLMTPEEYKERIYRISDTSYAKASNRVERLMKETEHIRELGKKTRTPNNNEKRRTLEEVLKDSPTFSSDGSSLLPTTMDDLDDI